MKLIEENKNNNLTNLLLKEFIEKEKSLNDIVIATGFSKTTILRYLKKYNIVYPKKGFYCTGSKIGRPAGFKHTEEEKKLQKERMIGYKNPFFGKRHSEETKLKMSLNHADFRGNKNPFKNSLKDKNKAIAHSERCKQIWKKRDQNWRNVFITKLQNRSADKQTGIGNYYGKGHKKGYIYCEKAKNFLLYYRSSYELFFINYVNKYSKIINISNDVATHTYKSFITNRIKKSFIDFLLIFDNNERLLIEIKPYSLLEYKKEQLIGQLEYCLENNLQYLILVESALFNEKLLSSLLEGGKNGEFYPTKIISTRIRNAFEFAKNNYTEWKY